MLTPEQIADGWIAHDGGECPVDPVCLVRVLFRGTWEPIPSRGLGKRARMWRWEFAPLAPASDIIAYRPEKPHD